MNTSHAKMHLKFYWMSNLVSNVQNNITMEIENGYSKPKCGEQTEKMFRIDQSESPGGGFGLKANCFIAPGTVILSEEACLVGPSTPYACIECLAAVISKSENTCSGCGHPMCVSCR